MADRKTLIACGVAGNGREAMAKPTIEDR